MGAKFLSVVLHYRSIVGGWEFSFWLEPSHVIFSLCCGCIIALQVHRLWVRIQLVFVGHFPEELFLSHKLQVWRKLNKGFADCMQYTDFEKDVWGWGWVSWWLNLNAPWAILFHDSVLCIEMRRWRFVIEDARLAEFFFLFAISWPMMDHLTWVK